MSKPSTAKKQLIMKDWSKDPAVRKHVKKPITWPTQQAMGIIAPNIMGYFGAPGSGKSWCAMSFLEFMKGVFSTLVLCAREPEQAIYLSLADKAADYGLEVVPMTLQEIKEGRLADIEQYDGNRLLLLDDWIGTKYPEQLITLANTGRHRNWSVWIINQSFPDVHKDVRGSMMYLILKRMPNDDNVARLLHTLSLPRAAVDLYREITADRINFLMIDCIGDESMRFRRNFEPIANLRQRLERQLVPAAPRATRRAPVKLITHESESDSEPEDDESPHQIQRGSSVGRRR